MVELDADRALALTYVPASRREAIVALWRLDVAMGAVLVGGREPLISQIKLTWWRDSLIKLDHAEAPAEPVLEGLSRHVLPTVRGEQLADMEAAWTLLLSQDPLTESELGSYASARGALLFRYSGHLLGTELTREMEQAGERWALMDLARHSNAGDAAAAVAAARERSSPKELRWPGPLRPLGMLAALAMRDAERGLDRLEAPGAPARMLRMLRHRFTGR